MVAQYRVPTSIPGPRLINVSPRAATNTLHTLCSIIKPIFVPDAHYAIAYSQTSQPIRGVDSSMSRPLHDVLLVLKPPMHESILQHIPIGVYPAIYHFILAHHETIACMSTCACLAWHRARIVPRLAFHVTLSISIMLVRTFEPQSFMIHAFSPTFAAYIFPCIRTPSLLHLDPPSTEVPLSTHVLGHQRGASTPVFVPGCAMCYTCFYTAHTQRTPLRIRTRQVCRKYLCCPISPHALAVPVTAAPAKCVTSRTPIGARCPA